MIENVWKQEIKVSDLQQLCARFEVSFNIKFIDASHIAYEFGDISWGMHPNNHFTFYEFYEVSLRLAKAYPSALL